MYFQPIVAVKTPPKTSPIPNPKAPLLENTESALDFSTSSVYVNWIKASALGIVAEAPRPCIARAIQSKMTLWPSPQTKDQIENQRRPARNNRLWPYLSPSLPPISKNVPKVRVNALTIQGSWLSEKWSSALMVGREMLTADKLATSRNWARQKTTRMAHLGVLAPVVTGIRDSVQITHGYDSKLREDQIV